MELRLTQPVAIQMFNVWATYLAANPGLRALEDGSIKLDSVSTAAIRNSSARGSVRALDHMMDGSTIIAWYVANGEATARAVAEARNATQVLGLPRSLYVGRLVDITRNQADNTVYMKFRTITRQDASGAPAYRTLNPSKGRLIELIINPSQAAVAAALSGQTTMPSGPIHTVPGQGA